MAEDAASAIAPAIRTPVFEPSRPSPAAAQAAIAAHGASTRLSLRLRASLQEAAQITQPAGALLPMPINSCIVSGARTIARLGPDEWLVLGAEADAEQIAAEFAIALRGISFSLIDISHRNVGIAVTGGRAQDVLNGGCPLDLSDGGFPAGTATRTVFGKAEIVLLRPGDESGYRVECWRSFAPYVQALLRHGAREFGGA